MSDQTWKTLLSANNLDNWGIPEHTKIQAELGILRQPKIDLVYLLNEASRNGNDELAALVKQGAILLYCDVLVLSASVTLPGSVWIIARRVEIAPSAVIFVDRTEDADPQCVFILGEIIDASTDNPISLPVRGMKFDGTNLTEIDLSAKIMDDDYASRILVKEQTTVHTLTADDADFTDGGPLRFLLDFQYQLGALLSHDEPKKAVEVLEWVAAVGQTHNDTMELGLDASVLAAQVRRIEIESHEGMIVPAFDHEVYRNAIVASTTYLSSKAKSFENLQLRQEVTDAWVDSATQHLEDKEADRDLARELANSAKQTRQDMQNARAAALRVMSASLREVVSAQINLEAGIEIWKRREQRKAAKDIVFGTAQLLFELPLLASAAPQMKEIAAMDTVIDGLRLASNASKLAFEEMTDFTVPGKDRTIEPKVSVYRRSLNRLQTISLPKRRNNSNPGEIELRNMSKAAPDINNLPPLPSNIAPIAPAPLTDQQILNLRAYERDRVIVSRHLSPLEDEAFNKLYTTRRDEATSTRAAKRAAIRNQLNKKLNLANATMNSLNRAYKAGSKIGKGINTIMEINERSEDLENRSRYMLDMTDGVFKGARPQKLEGLGLLTGGAEAWNTLSLDIESLFELVGDELMTAVDGMKGFRASVLHLVLAGRAHATAQLAVVKANTDASEANLRLASAERKKASIRSRVGKIEDRQAQVAHLSQMAFRKLLDAKRQVYRNLDNYSRAYSYFTLTDLVQNTRLPSLLASVDKYERLSRDVSGQILTVRALTQAPQEMSGVEVKITDTETLDTLRNTGRVKMTLLTTHPRFTRYARVRLSSIRIYLEGLQTDEVINIDIATTGLYKDKVSSNETRTFSASRLLRNFQYVPSTGRIAVDGKITQRFQNDYFSPTPFADWIISVNSTDASALDLSTIKCIKFVFTGSVTPV